MQASRQPQLRAAVAVAIRHLARDSAMRQQLAAAGAIPALSLLLQSPSCLARQAAARAVSNLVVHNGGWPSASAMYCPVSDPRVLLQPMPTGSPATRATSAGMPVQLPLCAYHRFHPPPPPPPNDRGQQDRGGPLWRHPLPGSHAGSPGGTRRPGGRRGSPGQPSSQLCRGPKPHRLCRGYSAAGGRAAQRHGCRKAARGTRHPQPR